MTMGHNIAAAEKAAALNALKKIEAGDGMILKGWLEYGAALNSARDKLPSNEQFGKWVKGNLPETEQKLREAAMWGAANPEELEQMQSEHENVRTLRGLHAKWLARSKPKPGATPEGKKTKRKEIATNIIALHPQGISLTDLHKAMITQDILPEGSDRNLTTQVMNALVREDVIESQNGLLFLKGEGVELNESQKVVVDKAIARERRKLEAEIWDRSSDIAHEFLTEKTIPRLTDEVKSAVRILSNREGLITKAEFKTLRMALHPDTTATKELKEKAFRIITSLEAVVMSEKDKPMTGGLPSSISELDALKAKVKAKRKK